MTVNAKNIIDKALLADDFMEIMNDYMECQQDNPNFDPRQALFDLYDDLVLIYEKAKDDDE
jgi:hypothetical protein